MEKIRPREEHSDIFRNHLTNHIIENEAVKEMISVKATEIISNGGHLGILVTDCDGLKRLNDVYGREVGDEAIIWTARQLDGAIKNNFKRQIDFLTTNQSDASDDLVTYFYNPTQEDINAIKIINDQLNKSLKTYGNVTNLFSISSGFISTFEPDMNLKVKAELKAIRDNPNLILYRFIGRMKNEADMRSKKIKEEKLIKSFETHTKAITNLLLNRQITLEEAIRMTAELYGGGRSSTEFLLKYSEFDLKLFELSRNNSPIH